LKGLAIDCRQEEALWEYVIGDAAIFGLIVAVGLTVKEVKGLILEDIS